MYPGADRQNLHPQTGRSRPRRLSAVICTRQMPSDHLIGHRQPLLVRAIAALDAGLLAHSAHPFIAASRLVSRLARLSAFKTPRVNLGAAPKQGSKQFDLREGWRCLGDGHDRAHRYRLGRVAANHSGGKSESLNVPCTCKIVAGWRLVRTSCERLRFAYASSMVCAWRGPRRG